jgi:hypothetical protein
MDRMLPYGIHIPREPNRDDIRHGGGNVYVLQAALRFSSVEICVNML